MTLMLSTRLSALLKCGWRSGFMNAGDRKKTEPLTVGLTCRARFRIKGCSISYEAGNVHIIL